MKKLPIILLILCLTTKVFGQWSGVKPMLGRQLNRAHPLGNPVAFWYMPEGSGNKVFDLSGNGNTGIFGGNVAWTGGKFGSCLTNFAAAGDVITIADNPTLDLTSGEYTIIAWVYNSGQTQTYPIIWIDGNFRLSLGVDDADEKLESWTNNATQSKGNTPVPQNVWSQVALVGHSATKYFYLNGIADGSGATSVYSAHTTQYIGNFPISDQHWVGNIDHILIYNHALTASEVALHYSQSFCMFEPSFDYMLYGGIGGWIGIDNTHYDSSCGDTDGHTASEALDGTDSWYHDVSETHWLIIDLGSTRGVTKIRGRSDIDADPVDIDIYVSDDKGSWGAAVKTNITTWQDTTTWVEIDTTDKDGRYIKIEIIETEQGVGNLVEFGNRASPFTIFDVYTGTAVAGVPVPVFYYHYTNHAYLVLPIIPFGLYCYLRRGKCVA